MDSIPTEIGLLTVPKHFHVQAVKLTSGRNSVIKNLGANLTFSGVKMFTFW
jgi:hypothetical protein